MQTTIQIGQVAQPSVLSQVKAAVKSLGGQLATRMARVRQAAAGVCFMLGFVLASGADTLRQAAVTAAVVVVAALLAGGGNNESKEGGAA